MKELKSPDIRMGVAEYASEDYRLWLRWAFEMHHEGGGEGLCPERFASDDAGNLHVTFIPQGHEEKTLIVPPDRWVLASSLRWKVHQLEDSKSLALEVDGKMFDVSEPEARVLLYDLKMGIQWLRT